MRLLHVGAADVRPCVAQPRAESDRGPGKARPGGKPLSLLQLQPLRGGRARHRAECYHPATARTCEHHNSGTGGRALMQSTPAPKKTIGQPTARIDGTQRVTGAAIYTGDVKLPGL